MIATKNSDRIDASSGTAAAEPAPRSGHDSARESVRWPAPWVFALLALPTGVFQSYLQTPLPYLLRQMGYSVDRIGGMVALVLVPMTLYCLWSPVVDFGLRRRTWIVLLSAVSAAMLLTGIVLLARDARLAIWILCTGFGVNLMTNSSAGGLLALTQHGPDRANGAAWLQGGGLAAQALGGAALLYGIKHFSLPVTCLLAVAMVSAPALIALTIAEPAPTRIAGQFRATWLEVGREIRATLFTWRSLPGVLLLMSPVGSGAAQSLFAAMAVEYHVGARGVMLLNGLLGGVLTMLGAFAAVLVPPHWDRRLAYAAAGLACAATGIFLAVAPMVPMVYFIGVGLYMLTVGLCFAFFLAVVMMTMGEAGKSASLRFTLLVSLGNLPIVYMTRVEGWGYGWFGPKGVPILDAAGNLLVALAVALWLGWRGGRRAGRNAVAATADCV